jgi:hypothetical protein
MAEKNSVLSTTPPTNSETGRAVKRRRRARLACQECRDRKIRCDGGTPVCDSCLRKNVDHRRCVYPAAPALVQTFVHLQIKVELVSALMPVFA